MPVAIAPRQIGRQTSLGGRAFRTDRRTFLTTTATTVAALSAGCLGGSADADADGPASEPTVEWAASPSDDDPLHGYSLSARSPARVADVAGEVDATDGPDDPYPVPWGDVAPEDLARFVSVEPSGVDAHNTYQVFRGTFDDSAARDALDASSDDSPERHEGHDLYANVVLEGRDGPPATYIVGDGVVVEIDDTYGEPGILDEAKRIVDVAVGERQLVTEVNAPIDTVVSRLEAGLTYGFERQDSARSDGDGGYEGVTAFGSYVALEDGALRRHAVFAFADEAAADADLFQEYATDAYDAVDIEASTVEVDGAVVTGSGEVPPDETL